MSSKPQVVESIPLPGAVDPPIQDQNGNVPASRVLNSWKDIANYLGRGVRTVQRYESQFGLPVRRPAGKGRSSVMAFADELDGWLGHAPTKNSTETSHMLFIFSSSRTGTTRNRLLVEVATFNVQSECSTEDILQATQNVEINGVVVECPPGDDAALEICRCVKERHPGKQIFAVPPEPPGVNRTFSATEFATGSGQTKLLRALMGVLATSQAA